MQKPKFAPIALALGLLWLAAGALFKLFEGSPNDLPATVKDLSPLGGLETMRAAIMIELAVIGLVIARPRVGWVFLAGAFATFIAVLYPLVQEGATSCGCFGGNIEIDPKVMMGIDGGLLLLLLISAPWRLPRDSGLGTAAFLPFLAVAVAAPWQKIQPESTPTVDPARRAELLSNIQGQGGGAAPAPGGLAVSGGASGLEAAPVAGAPEGQPAANATGVDPGAAAPTETSPVAPVDPRIDPPVDPPVDPPADPPAGDGLPEFYAFEPFDAVKGWVGKDFYETDVANFYFKGADLGLEQGAVNPNSHVIIYRRTCEVCRDHLQEVWQEVANGNAKWLGKTIVLLRIVENKDATAENLCTVLPESNPGVGILVERIQLPALKRGYGITTPYTFDVDENLAVQNPVDLRTVLGH